MTPEWLVHDPKSEREEPAAPTRGRDIIQRNAKGEVWRGLPSMGRELEGAGRSPAPSWGEFERGGLPPTHSGSIGPKSGFLFLEMIRFSGKEIGAPGAKAHGVPVGNLALSRRARPTVNMEGPAGWAPRARAYPHKKDVKLGEENYKVIIRKNKPEQ